MFIFIIFIVINILLVLVGIPVWISLPLSITICWQMIDGQSKSSSESYNPPSTSSTGDPYYDSRDDDPRYSNDWRNEWCDLQ